MRFDTIFYYSVLLAIGLTFMVALYFALTKPVD